MKQPALQKRILFLFVVSIFTTLTANANNYYFSSATGNDARDSIQAQNPATPWKTINKLNSFFSALRPGDSVLFHRSETFDGLINVKTSGTLSMPVVFASYGKGNDAVISGLAKISSWSSVSNGIYQSNCSSCIAANNILIINGNPQALGRYPNKGYLTYQSHNGNNSISDKDLPEQPNWLGSDIVIKKKHWIIDKSNITSQKNGTLNYASGTSSSPTDHFGYFIQNDPRTLDRFGEWYFNATAKKMEVFFGDENPSAYNINASTENILININGQNFLHFIHLSLEGANLSAFKIKNAKNITIQNCAVDFSGTDAIDASASPNLLIENSFINHSQNDAIVLDSSCRFGVIKNNRIINTGLMPGMGKNGTGSYQAVSSFGESSIIECNEIDSIGYNGIFFGGNNSIAKNNFIQNFCCVKDDGAGIYIDDWFPSTGKKITGNIILNGIGSNEGTNTTYSSQLQVEGIYIDDNTADVTIDSNTVANCPHTGIMIHNANNIKIEDNLIFNNSIQLLLQHDNLGLNSPIKNLTANRNILFSQNTNQVCVNILWLNDNMWSFGFLDNNFYYHPDDDKMFQAVSNIWTSRSVTKKFSLLNWQKINNQDIHSKEIFTTSTDPGNFHLEYNPSDKSKTILLTGFAVDAAGIINVDHFTLLPYHSIIISNTQINYY